MKIFIGILLGVMFSLNSSAQILGTPVVYYDFGTGIPAGFQNTSTSGISHWEYRGPNTDPNNTVASRGSCGAGSLPIESMTASNGFVIFDSNYWDDNDGVCGGLGTGQDPAPHDASLITPAINLSAYTSAVVTWQQSFKDYQATLTAEVSNDGGATWTVIYTNAGSFTDASEWQTFNITSLAAGHADVRVRFHFTGIYYWWQLDDIAIYTPNPNDIMIQNARYTTYTGALDFMDMPYDSYPSIMIPNFKFAAQSVNIGANLQTNVKLQSKVFLNGAQQFNGISTQFSQPAGNTHLFSVSGTWPPSSVIGDYIVTYNVDQVETDSNTDDNWDTLDYRITPFTYARDERFLEDVFIPALAYQNESYEVGNIMQSRGTGQLFHSVGVVIGEGSVPQTPIYASVYLLTSDSINGNVSTLLSTSAPYLINPMDISAVGQEHFVSIPLLSPITLANNAMYYVVVGFNPDGGGLLRVGRSGATPDFSSLVSYPESNGLFYLLKCPMVRMHVFPAGSTPGCMNATADNYNPAATVDNGTCHQIGCTDPLACNYDPTANYDDFNCAYYGCTNPAACNYNADFGCDDGTCVFAGCTDPAACNYNPLAGCNDGSCGYPGCTDPGAPNYDPTALCDNGTCESGCDGDFNHDDVVNVQDLLLFSSAFGCIGGCQNGDINGDDVVNVQDLLLFTTAFGTTCN